MPDLSIVNTLLLAQLTYLYLCKMYPIIKLSNTLIRPNITVFYYLQTSLLQAMYKKSAAHPIRCIDLSGASILRFNSNARKPDVIIIGLFKALLLFLSKKSFKLSNSTTPSCIYIQSFCRFTPGKFF